MAKKDKITVVDETSIPFSPEKPVKLNIDLQGDIPKAILLTLQDTQNRFYSISHSVSNLSNAFVEAEKLRQIHQKEHNFGKLIDCLEDLKGHINYFLVIATLALVVISIIAVELKIHFGL